MVGKYYYLFERYFIVNYLYLFIDKITIQNYIKNLRNILYYTNSMQEYYYILFKNMSNLPIMVDCWVNKSSGISIMKSVCVAENEECILPSNIGEWYVHRMLYDHSMIDKWKKDDTMKKCPLVIGKFHSYSTENGKYASLDTDLFTMIYEHIEYDCIYYDYIKYKNLKGKIIFQLNE